MKKSAFSSVIPHLPGGPKLLLTLITALSLASPALAQRVPWRQPFAGNCIWNTPIGSGALYSAPIGLGKSDEFAAPDVEYHIRGLSSDPQIYTNSYAGNIAFPYRAMFDLSFGGSPNTCTSYLQPDGSTLWQWQYSARSGWGADITTTSMQVGSANHWNDTNLFSQSTQAEWGTHGGSKMSTLGGSLRLGEATSGPDLSDVNTPNDYSIRHALKINIDGGRYLYKGTAAAQSGDRYGFGYRWPAFGSDTGASNFYGGTNPQLAMGSLLAIPASINLNTLSLQTRAGKKLAWTAKNFGFYIVDQSGWTANEISCERGVPQELQAQPNYGSVPDSRGFPSTFNADMMKIFARLCVVTNNASSAIGGPGSRLTAGPASPGNVNNIPNGIYRIKNKATGTYCDVNSNSMTNGARIILYPGHSGSNQQFTLSHRGNGFYTVSAVSSGKIFDIVGGSTSDSADLEQWDLYSPAADNQLWSFIPLNGTYFFIQVRHSDKVLQTPSSTNPAVRQMPFTGQDTQLWSLEYVGPAASSTSTSFSGTNF